MILRKTVDKEEIVTEPEDVVFLEDKYLRENADVHEAFEKGQLKSPEDHYQTYGAGEYRGTDTSQVLIVLEQLTACRDGTFVLVGWCNRNVFDMPTFVMEIGYFRFSISAEDGIFFARRDVGNAIGDERMLAAFVIVARLPRPIGANQATVGLSNNTAKHTFAVKPESRDVFLNSLANVYRALSPSISAATRVQIAKYFSDKVAHLWEGVLDDVSSTMVCSLGDVPRTANSLITVLYNEFEFFAAQYILFSRYLDARDINFVLVINGTTKVDLDEFLQQTKALYQIYRIPIRVYVMSRNSGFSCANNAGIGYAETDRITMINPDVFPIAGKAQGLRDFLSLDCGQDIYSCLLNYGNGALMHAGMYIEKDLYYEPNMNARDELLRVEHFGKGSTKKDRFYDDDIQVVPATTGALISCNRQTIERLHGLSVDFIYAHYEDADLCFRLQESGSKVRLVNDALFYHLEGVSKHTSPIGAFCADINRYRFTEKWSSDYERIQNEAIAIERWK